MGGVFENEDAILLIRESEAGVHVRVQNRSSWVEALDEISRVTHFEQGKGHEVRSFAVTLSDLHCKRWS